VSGSSGVGVVLAIAQAVRGGHWADAAVLATVAAQVVVCPVVDAAVCRRAEFSADRFAAEAGVGPELAAALQDLDCGDGERGGWITRMVSSHPDTARRIAAVSEMRTT
jgi:STE24 endopeptidase